MILFSGDFLDKILVYIFCDQLRQRRIVGQRRALEQTGYVVGENVLSSVFRKNIAQLTVMLAAEESERSNQRAGADAGDEIEHRPGARIAPADQQAGAKGAVFGAAGNGEKICERLMPFGPRRPSRFRFRRIRHHDRLDVPGRRVAPETDVMKSLKLDLARAGLRQDAARRNGCASAGDDCRKADQAEENRPRQAVFQELQRHDQACGRKDI